MKTILFAIAIKTILTPITPMSLVPSPDHKSYGSSVSYGVSDVEFMREVGFPEEVYGWPDHENLIYRGEECEVGKYICMAFFDENRRLQHTSYFRQGGAP